MQIVHPRTMSPAELLEEIKQRHMLGQDPKQMAEELQLSAASVNEMIAKVRASITLEDYNLPKEVMRAYAERARYKVGLQGVEQGLATGDARMVKVGLEALKGILEDTKPKTVLDKPLWDQVREASSEVSIDGLLADPGEQGKDKK